MISFTKVAAGHATSAAIDDTGRLWVTGANPYGQLGVGDTDTRHRFTPVALDDIVDVAVSSTHIVVLDAHGIAYAAGRRSTNGGAAPVTRFTRIAERVTAIAAGAGIIGYTRDDGDLWASTSTGRGPQRGCEVSVHERISAPDGLVDLAFCGNGAHLARRDDGALVTWSKATNSTNAVLRDVDATFRAVALIGALQYHAVVDDNGAVWFTGQRGYGNPLRHGDPNSYHRLIGDPVTAFAAGNAHSLLVDTDGQLWSSTGAEGTDVASLPVDVPFRAVDVAAGTRHSLVVDTDGQLWGSGDSGDGQLGCVGAPEQTFTRLEIGSDVAELAAELGNVDTPISVTYDTARAAYA